jgi:hypothetical protein
MIPGLNLLPPNQKQVVSEENTVIHWRGSLLLVAMMGLLMIAGLALAHFQLQSRVRQTGDQLTQQQLILQRTGATDITAVTERVNFDINLLSQALGAELRWVTALTNITALVPSRIKITKLTITTRRQVTLEGVAETRAVFLGFDSTLRNTKLLTNVSTTSTASLRENLPFIYHAVLAN